MTPQRDKKQINISSDQLEQILETNSKAIEIYLEVSNQYAELDKKVDKILDKSCNHIAYNDKAVEKLTDNMGSFDKKYVDDHKNINEKISSLIKMVDTFERNMFKQNIVIITQLVIIIAMVISKIMGM